MQFPAHAGNILTTTVVKAMRADLKGLAYAWAIVVFRPEYKSQVLFVVARSLRNTSTGLEKWP